jgi:hypothetical protein
MNLHIVHLDISLISFEQLQLQPQKLLLSKKLRKQIGKKDRGHKTEHLALLESLTEIWSLLRPWRFSTGSVTIVEM